MINVERREVGDRWEEQKENEERIDAGPKEKEPEEEE